MITVVFFYFKWTFRVDNEGTYTIEFNTGGNSGNLDIGWNAVFNKKNEPVLIQQGQNSDENIYPYFSLSCPEFYYNNNFIASFNDLLGYACN